jgi:integrase
MALTDKAIRALQAGDPKRRHFDEKGLYLELSPAGGKWWRFKYRFAGKEKLLSMGVFPEVSLADARKRRDKARALLDDGVDPGAERKAEAQALRIAALNTLEAVARAWLAHMTPGWSEHTLGNITASLENHVFPRIGKRPVTEITAGEIRDAVKAIDAAGARDQAGRVFQRLKAIYRYSIQHDLCEADPTYSLRPSEILSRQDVKHRAALAERDVPVFLRKLDSYEGDPNTRNALEFLMLTATRPGETRGATWPEIDEDRALWRIPAERMKMKTEHLVPLSPQALAVLKRARELASSSPLVFPSPFYPGKPLSENTLNSMLARLGYKGMATAHGFRTLFSTVANEAGWNADAIERQLAHEERDAVRGAYNRALMLPERTKLMKWWGDKIDALRQGAKVLPIKAA